MIRDRMRIAKICLLFTLLVLAACAPQSSYTPPAETGDGWETTSPNKVNMDEQPLQDMQDALTSKRKNVNYANVHGIVIVKDNKVVFEYYAEGYTFRYSPSNQYKGALVDFDADTIHNLASVTKAVTSALIGIAIDQGLIENVHTPIVTFFPEYADLFDEEKATITVHHLLTMSSGLEWSEGDYGDSRNNLIRLFSESDPVRYILSKPLIHEPGSTYYYSGGDVNLLGEIIQQVSGQRMDHFGNEHLLAPLGITSYRWDFINHDVVHASGNLYLRPRDVAKFGTLYLNGGAWQSQRIISQDWVDLSTQGHIGMGRGGQYGYQWHLKTYYVEGKTIHGYCKEGWGGQRVTVFPDLNLVTAFTGGNYVRSDPIDTLTKQYILPSVLND